LNYYPGIYLDGLRRSKKELRIAGLPTEVRSCHFSNARRKLYAFDVAVHRGSKKYENMKDIIKT
jgi:hypothetical protein